MRLAPVILMRRDVLAFGHNKSRRDLARGQVVDFHENPVRRACVRMAGMAVVRRRRIVARVIAGKRIYPGARTQIRARIETGAVKIRTAGAQARTTYTIAPKTAGVA